jgi:predicted Zn-dependent protease
MEQSADQGALQFLDSNHWSAQGMLDLFAKLQEEDALVAELQDPYLITHPLTKDRIRFVREHVAASPYSNNPLPAGFEDGFQMVRAKLRAFLDPSSVTLRRVPESDRSAPARYARAIAHFRLGHLKEALPLIDGLIAEKPASPWLHELKGQMLFEGGRVREALAPYREAARLAPEQPQIRASLARAMIEADDPALLRPAVAELQSALARERDDAESWRALGVAWGRLGNLGQANLALAEQAMLAGDIRTARQFASKAEKLLPPGPPRLRATDISNAVKKENREGF